MLENRLRDRMCCQGKKLSEGRRQEGRNQKRGNAEVDHLAMLINQAKEKR